jgi:molybdopterin synthase catalytic subunit/molybdopterin synthase sulfur carrier subunit
MARLRFFAQAREAAGCKEAVIEAGTLGSLLDAACERFGPGLAAVLETSAVWVNGEPAGPGQRVGEGDEVAILPPVSGG